MKQFSDFFDSEEPANEVFMAALNVVYDEGDGITEHIDRLSKESRIVYLLWSFDGEVHNGGFDQLFTNSLGNHCLEILECLSILGAKNSHKLLSSALGWFPNSSPSRDRVVRYEQHQIFSENAEYEQQINSIDKEFYLYKDNLSALINKYVISNPVVRPEFPRHFPVSKNTVVHTPLAARDYCEYVCVSGCRTSRYS